MDSSNCFAREQGTPRHPDDDSVQEMRDDPGLSIMNESFRTTWPTEGARAMAPCPYTGTYIHGVEGKSHPTNRQDSVAPHRSAPLQLTHPHTCVPRLRA